MSRHQVTVQAGVLFPRKITDSGVMYKPSSSGGGLVGYRYNINRWLGVEGDYYNFRNSQKFLIGSSTYTLKANIHAVTGAAVVNIPNPLTKRMKSYALVGGGALLFYPRETGILTVQTRNVIVFGGGMDIPVTRYLSIRAQGANFLYKAPDFGIDSLKTNKYAQAMVPSAGLVFNF